MSGIYLKQSTASQSRALGPFIDDTDFKTAETALTIANTDIKLVVNGAASANKNSGGGTHRVNGVYSVTFDATDTATVGEVQVSVVVSGALPVFHTFFVLEESVYDNMFAVSAVGPLTAAQVNAECDTALSDYDGPTNAEMIARTRLDADYFSWATDTVANVTTVGTTTANTDMRGTDGASTHNAAAVYTAFGTGSNLTALTTATGFSTHDAAAVVTALGTGTTLTACATATGFSTHSAADIWTSGTRTLTATVDANITQWSGYTLIAGMIETDSGASRWVTKALEQAPSGGGGGGDATEAKQDTIIAAIGVVDGNVDAILVDTGTTLPARFTGIEGATFSTSTDSLEAIRNRGDSAWTTGAGGGGGITSNYATAIKNTVYDITLKLYDISGKVVSSPTLATGDVVVTKDAGTPVNITTLPTTANDDQVTVALTADEMNADNVIVELEDQAGGEWEPVTVHINPQTLATSGLTGARTVAITVDDGTNPIQNAKVRFTLGAQTGIQSTDVNGQTSFSVDDGTWTVAITASGYSFSSTTLVVDGDENETYSMTQVVITPTANPSTVNAFVVLQNESALVSGTACSAVITSHPTGSGTSFEKEITTATTGVDGLFQFEAFVGGTYKVRLGGVTKSVPIPSDAADPYEIPNSIFNC